MEKQRVNLPPNEQPRREGGLPRVLMIEPDSLLRWSISRCLDRGFEVIETGSLADAESLEQAPPFRALIISDSLPSEQTEALVRRLRKRSAQLTVVALLSGPAEPWHREERVLLLEKPFKLSALAELLEMETTSQPEKPGG